MILRPKEKAKADTFDSGKKKRHTLKMQVVVDEETGEFVDVSCSFPGPMADFKVLGELDLFSRLPAGIGALGDLAYVGMDELSPELAATMPRCKPRGQPREGGGPGQPSTPAQGGRLEEDRHPRRHRGDRRDGRPEGDHRGDHPRQGNLPVDVEVFAGAVRGHWAVENTCHWTLDVTFREDDSRIRERVLGANITWL